MMVFYITIAVLSFFVLFTSIYSIIYLVTKKDIFAVFIDYDGGFMFLYFLNIVAGRILSILFFLPPVLLLEEFLMRRVQGKRLEAG